MSIPVNERYQPYLEKIKGSSDFKNSDKFQELLQYLIEQTIAGNYVKEISIAIDVFHNEHNFNPSQNPSVRVNISKLRKNLRNYYLTEGNSDTIRFELPKGKYVINLVEVKRKSKSASLRNTWLYTSLALGLISILSLTKIWQDQYRPPEFWRELFTMNEKPILLLAGSFLHARGEFVNQYDLEEFLQKQADDSTRSSKEFKLSDRNYLIPGTVWGVQKIISILENAKVEYNLKLASEVTHNDIQNYNIIYVGNIWDAWVLNEYEAQWKVENWNPPQGIEIVDSDTIRFIREGAGLTEKYQYQKHLGWLAFHKGPTDNYILFFGGFNTEGNVGLTNYCTAPDFYDRIQKLNKKDPYPNDPYFDLILDIEGVKRNVSLIEPLYFRSTNF